MAGSARHPVVKQKRPEGGKPTVLWRKCRTRWEGYTLDNSTRTTAPAFPSTPKRSLREFSQSRHRLISRRSRTEPFRPTISRVIYVPWQSNHLNHRPLDSPIGAQQATPSASAFTRCGHIDISTRLFP